MRTFCVIYLCTVFWSVSAVTITNDNYYRKNNFAPSESGNSEIIREPLFKTTSVLLTSEINKSRRKRESIKEEETTSPILTRHAKHRRRRRCKNDAACSRSQHRARKHQQIQRKRNFEKQVLVRNRTLELLGHGILDLTKNKTGVGPSGTSTVLEPEVISKKVGDILGESGTRPRLKITDLLLPKIFPKENSGNFDRRLADLPGKDERNDTSVKVESAESEFSEIGPAGTHARKEKTSRENVLEENARSRTEVDARASFLSALKQTSNQLTGATARSVPKAEDNGNGTELEVSAGDFYKSGYRYDYENVFEDPSVSSWVNPGTDEQTTSKDDFMDSALLSSVYMPIDDQIALHESLATLLSRLFQTLRNTTIDSGQESFQDLDFDNSLENDLCQKWLDCKDKLEEAFLGPLVSLPACPCHYPSSIFYDDKIWDEIQQKHFRWRDVSGDSERVDVYKPGATYCVRSLLAQGSGSAAAQHCCYDRRRRLLTRGSGAGTPNFVSPEVSAILHERIDILPWRLCKGDFSRFNKVRPPNNDNHCKANPDDEEYQHQIDNTKYY